MIDLKRRRLMKSALAAPLCFWLDPLVSDLYAGNTRKAPAGTQPEITFDILLHGMFAIVMDSSGVSLLPPHVEGETPHMYLAGDMRGSIDTAKRLDRGGYYELHLPSAKKIPQPNKTVNVIVPLSKVTRSSVQPHCTINLPWPDDVVPLRSVAPLDAHQPLFTDPTGLVCQPSQLPLVTMLRYRLSAGLGQDLHYKYHLFAEPKVCPGKIHPSEALDTLKSLFKGIENLTFNNCLTMNDLAPMGDPAGAGASVNDEKALVERLGSNCTDSNSCQTAPPPIMNACVTAFPAESVTKQSRVPGKLAVHPTACMSIIFIG